MEQINIKKAEIIVENLRKYIGNNQRLLELFTTQPVMKMEVYKKTTIYYAKKMYEELSVSNEAIPHGFYAILENEIKTNGLLPTLRKFKKEITLISETMQIEEKDLVNILKYLKSTSAANPDNTMEQQNARNSLKEIIRKFTAKYKENYIKNIVNEKMALLRSRTIKKEAPKEQVFLTPEGFVNFVFANPPIKETIEVMISEQLGTMVSKEKLKEIIAATFERDYTTAIQNILQIPTPLSYEKCIRSRHQNRLKKNYEPILNKNLSLTTDEEKIFTIRVIEHKVKEKKMREQGMTIPPIAELEDYKKIFTNADLQLIEEVCAILTKTNASLILLNGKFRFYITETPTKEEIEEAKNYENLVKHIKSIHNHIYSLYARQNKMIGLFTTKSPTPIASSDDSYQIDTDCWFTEEKITKVIDKIDKNKIASMSEKTYQILKEFLIKDGLLWAYVADNIDIDTFVKIINNFDSIAACCTREEISISNLHRLIRKANLYDYANDLMIGLVGQDILAKVINYNQFSGVTVTDEVIHTRLRKLVDLAVKAENTPTSSLPFTCDVTLGKYRLQRYKNNDPKIFTSGIDTKTCFFISVNENDFFFYSLLNKNGYVVKVVNERNEVVARASCFRKNNVLMINGIRCKNNNIIPNSKEDFEEMKQIVKLIELMAKKMIELTSSDLCPIDYVVCNKAGILENAAFESNFEQVNSDLFREPINIYDKDWEEFVHLYDGQEQLLQEVPHNPNKSFTTDFGNHYPTLLIASRNYMPLTSPRNISLNDQPSTYDRPRSIIKQYIGEEITDDILARINRIKALDCFNGSPEEQEKKKKEYRLLKDTKTIKSIILGEDWYKLTTIDNQVEIIHNLNSRISYQEAIDYIFETQLQSPTQPNEDVKVYQYQPK